MRSVPGEPEAGGWRDATLEELLDRLLAAAGPVTGRPVVVAIDGRSSSGKTSLSERLAAVRPGGYAVHTDDVAWFHSAFDWVDELVDGVLAPVHRGEAVAYRPPGWVARGRPGAVEVPAGLDLLVVEGIASSRPALAGWYDAVVYVQSDDVVRRERDAVRIAAGEISPASAAAWEAEEEPLLLADRPWERATLVVCGTPDLLPEPPPAGRLAVTDEPPGRRVHLLEATYAAVTATVQGLAEPDFGAPTRTAWTVRELLFHLLLDAQRTLIALASPTEDAADVDAASYWRPFVPGSDPDAEADHLRWVQGSAAAYPSAAEVVRHWTVTAAAAVRAVRRAWYADPAARVATQGHVLTVDALTATLVVESTVHLLDLTVAVPGEPPPPGALAATRAVLDEILGDRLPAAWTDTEAVLVGTGRRPPTDDERAALGAAADRIPLLG